MQKKVEKYLIFKEFRREQILNLIFRGFNPGTSKEWGTDLRTSEFIQMNNDLTFFTDGPGETLLERSRKILKDVRFFDILVGWRELKV